MTIDQRRFIAEPDVREHVHGPMRHGHRRRWMVTALVFFALAVAIGALGWVMFGAMPAQVVLASMVLAIPLAWGAAVDWHDFIVPDRVSLGLIPLGLGMTWLVNPAVLSAHIVAALAGGLLLWVVAQGYRRFRGVAGLGLGDVKLLAAAGAWLGPEGLPGVLLIGSLAAIAALLVRRGLTGPRALRGRIAFAPYLALGIWVTWIFGSITWGA